MLYWHNNGERTLTKQRFAKIFTPVWDLCMTPSNIKSGFRATGLYPYDPNAIPEEAFKPSIASELPVPPNYGQLLHSLDRQSYQLLNPQELMSCHQMKSILLKLL
jgi:hypothetical protein